MAMDTTPKHVYVLFQLVACILIGVAAYAKAIAFITSLSLMSGIIACGVFLFLVALVGLLGAIKHHQVMLFFVSFDENMISEMAWVEYT